MTSFDVHFHDQIVTRRQIIYGHTWGLDQQKYFFERLHWKFRRKIGQIDSQTPKREKNPKKERKYDTKKIARRRLDTGQKSNFEVRYVSCSRESKKCTFQVKKYLIVILSVIWFNFDFLRRDGYFQ